MPSIRGYKKGIDSQALKEFVDKYTAHMATIAAKAGKQVMENIRSAAVRTWYHSTAEVAMNESTVYESDSPKQAKNKIEITIRSYIDINKFEEMKRSASDRNWFASPYESVKRWRERHEKDGWRYYGRESVHMYEENLNRLGTYQPSRPAISMPYSIGEYLFNLPWEEGIVGLPEEERYTDTGWVNPSKNAQRDSLKSYVNERFKKEWSKQVNEEFAKISQK